MLWTIAITALVAVLAVVLALNFAVPEKKLERKIEHRYAVADPQFRRDMAVMLGPTIVQGNRITAYQNGDEIFPAMFQAIAAAKHTITFETYIYWSGKIGKQFAQVLSERAQAGVDVHVTIDWVGSVKMDEALLKQMESAGVKLRRYRPLHWYNLGRMNNRTHRKLLIVDGKVGFTGGVGIADQWLGHAQDADHWRDSHFRVEGPVVAQMQAAFTDNWIKMSGEVLNGVDYFPPSDPAGGMDAQLFTASPAGGSESMHLMYLLSIAAAASSIDLEMSYFVPDDLLVESLIAARKRGVRVRILLPGPIIDSDTVRLASRDLWGDLLLAGVEIFEYQPTMLHVKMLVIDSELVSVGSTNMDLRSLQLNDEASLNIYDREFAGQMIEVFEADLKHTVPYTYAKWKDRPLKEKFAERFVRPLRSQL